MVEEVKVSTHLPKDQVVRHKTFENECKAYCKRITVRKPGINKSDFSSEYQNILTNISFSINSGQILTVIGDAGSGKVYLNLKKSTYILSRKQFKLYFVVYRVLF